MSQAVTCPHCAAPVTPSARFCRTCGRDLAPAGDVDAALAPVPISSRPTWRSWAWWRARWGRVLAIATVLTFAITAAVIWFGQDVVNPPDGPVRAWFAVLERRDTAAAAALSPAALLRDDFLAAAGYVPPADVQIGEISYGGPQEQQRPNKAVAYVAVSYTVAGQHVETSVAVTRDRTGPVREWSLSDGTTGLLDVVGGAMQRARIGNAYVATLRTPRPTTTAATDGALALPPGVYTVTGTDQDTLFTAAAKTVAVPGGRGRPASVTLDLTVKPEALATINDQVRARVDVCAQRADPDLPACPFSRNGSYLGKINSAKWTITKYPVIELTPVDKPYQGGPLATLTTATAGVARLEVAAFATGGKTVVEEYEITVYGDIKLQDGKLLWVGGKSGILF
ncbi:zinc ribbon domain-containing protein [Hamadaea sp. NPDC051192]|uniref:zinc ribbon domain-containing protein n=1 Tax=Hamadaea sp. NPDC051192 TaxID=3154940 RepID=UPI00342035B4